MKIVITGALGHIGSRLIRELPRLLGDPAITMVDNFLTQRYGSLFDLPTGRYRFIEADVMTADLDTLVRGADAVVHLAGITDAASSFGRKDEVERINYDGTVRIAEACAAAGAALLFASTTSVYGTQADVVDEDCPLEHLKPQSPYAESKLRAERMLEELGRTRKLRFVTCRFGTIFGTSPGMRFHTAVNKFVWQACFGQPLTVWRTALEQRRPYLDLGDCCRAIAFLLGRDHFDGKVYNVLTANATVAEIVDAIRMHFPDLSVKLVDSPIMNQLSYTVQRLRFENLGFRFEGSLAAGIGATAALLGNARGKRAVDAAAEG
jgi:nucleoside-diphosphate-sugar epimerase